jgi:hypothetical protein
MAPALSDIVRTAIAPAFALLPARYNTPEALTLLLAIGLQESRFEHRRQLGGGPARGFWQFELGSRASRGGVWGVYLHQATSGQLRLLCLARKCAFVPLAIYLALEHDDVLAAGVARLLLFTDPRPLPALGDAPGAWEYYLRTWRPGKPHRRTWKRLYEQALVAALASLEPDARG